MKIEIYDPPMCCSNGLCGPLIDSTLVAVSDAILSLQKQGVEVIRFNLAQQTKAYLDRPEVSTLLHRGGKKILPITLVDGEVFRTGTYPTYQELCQSLGIEPLLKRKPMTIQISDGKDKVLNA